jgi:hypothetical protein
MTDILFALRDTFPVDPWLAVLWFCAAIGLAGLLVYVWRRVAGL